MTRPTAWPEVHFDHPPVVEVVCGVVFEPVPLSAAHLGVLWMQYGEEFPKTADKSPIPSRAGVDGEAKFTLPIGGIPRVWFVSEDERRIVQVQRDRFHFNWRKREPDDQYPRYPAVYTEFKRHHATFDRFLEEGGDTPTRALVYELSYVNRIPHDAVWAGLGNLGRVLPDVAWRAREDRYLPAPDSIQMELSFPMAEEGGRIWVALRSVRRKDTGEPELALDLTARGAAGTRSTDDWFRDAHEWIVQGFADLTGREIQDKVWKRRKA